VDKIRLKIDPDRITIDDLIAIEDGSIKTRAVRDLIARFIVDERGEFLEDEEAKKLVGKLTLTELLRVGAELGAKVQEMVVGMVPTKTVSE